MQIIQYENNEQSLNNLCGEKNQGTDIGLNYRTATKIQQNKTIKVVELNEERVKSACLF